MKSDFVVLVALTAATIGLLATVVLIVQLKLSLDDIRYEFDSEVGHAESLREVIGAEVKTLPVAVRTRRQTYYERVTEAYAKPAVGVEAQPPSFSPRSFPAFCNCNTENNCPAGPPGAPGPKGHNGHAGDDGPPGKPGLPCDDVTPQMYEMPCQFCPAGQQGPAGSPGSKGPRGSRGQNGSSGMPGSNGMPGRNGDMGQPGVEGVAGKQGDPGRAGMDFVKEQGLPGLKGATGEQGSIGPIGDRGNDGVPGNIGKGGAVGSSGKPGKRGRDGKNGKVGAPGNPGFDAMYCPCPHRSSVVPTYSTGPY